MLKTQSEKSVESFDQLVNKIRNASNITLRDKGTLFEYMVKVYLEQAYPINFSHVWMLKEVPSWTGISHVDNGIDLVCQEANSKKFVGVQAKFYKESTKVTKKDVDTFIAGLGNPVYSYGIFVTSNDNFDKFAKMDLHNQSKDIIPKGLPDLRDADIDWTKFDDTHLNENSHKDLRKNHKKLRDYQKIAVKRSIKHYRKAYQEHKDLYRRGLLIMAPGTGKTYTSLNIAEALQNDQNKNNYYVLYLVPSIQLLSQTLYSWYQDVNSDTEIQSFAVTSDYTVNHFKKHPYSIPKDLGYPATTNSKQLINDFNDIKNTKSLKPKRMYVVFSTYQSISVIHNAQKNGFPDFDFTICDEAHRTAGTYKSKAEVGFFSKILQDNYVKSKLRLFQTATPKIYGTRAKNKGEIEDATLYSMNDPKVYGTPIYRLTFGKAVQKYHCLTDYKVEVLTIDEHYIEKHMQQSLSKNGADLPIDMVGKIVGTWNAMLKRKSFSKKTWGRPMKRAIAFAQVINSKNKKGKIGSKQLSTNFNTVMKNYLDNDKSKDYKNAYHITVKHADGSMNDTQKKARLDWLKAPVQPNHAKILSNVRFLGEGVDVPSLDAIIFYAPKKSEVDIVQAVGRVMRLFHGKKYGYIILPIVIPYGKNPREVLSRNDTYRDIWQVLNALRSIDERIRVEIDKLNFHDTQSPHIHVHTIGDKNGNDDALPQTKQESLNLVWKGLYNAITGEIVQHVGDRRYLEDWSDLVGKIATRQVGWIKVKLQNSHSSFAKTFSDYWMSLKHDINNRITKQQAIDMIAQHIITKPIFNALFSNNDFVKNNPVSKAMEGITNEMIKAGFQKQQDKLKPLYKSVRKEASGIHDPNDKQQFIRILYNRFFSKSFKSTTSRLGIVFTPVQIVNFIVHSVNYALHKFFNKSIASKGVNILDPFVGTGTFITQTLYYLANLWKNHKIKLSDIIRNYTQELYCNEIVLLSYYIAAINIESVFNEIVHNTKYKEFKGIVLTDTFESNEINEASTLDQDIFPDNNKRLKAEKKKDIKVIMSNPPYSKGQKNANDNQQNMSYPHLENEIKNTYVKNSKSPYTGRIYNSYIKAIRWASDKIGKRGIVGLVTSAGFIRSRTTNGMRKCLFNEYNYLYIFNLKGNQHLAGQEAKEQGGGVFGQGTMSPIAISILVKDGSNNHKLFIHNIDNNLSGKEKLDTIKKDYSIKNIKWSHNIVPDKNNDWINKINPIYQKFMPLHERHQNSIFPYNALGIQTKRDAWVYGFSKESVAHNVNNLINHYNQERLRLLNVKNKMSKLNTNPKYIKWSTKLKRRFRRNKPIKFHKSELVLSLYRPFTKKYLYYDKDLVEGPGAYYDKFGKNNIVIFTTGRSSARTFSALATNLVPESKVNDNGEGFMRYNNEIQKNTLFKFHKDNINSTFAHKLNLSTTNTFYYIYGILNSEEYRNNYKIDLRKNLARIPIVKNVTPFVIIGKKLMKLHVNYDKVPVYKGIHVKCCKNPNYQVIRMRHGTYRNNKYPNKSSNPAYQNLKFVGRKKDDLTTIIYNPDITITNIPLKAYNYTVNGKAAIDWVLDQYRIKKNKQSGIIDDPNKFSKDPKYIFKLLLKVINVSVKTVNLVNKLPKMQITNYD